jgi:hypothetical protein
MSKWGLIVATVLAASVMAVGFSAWRSLADVDISGSGIVAMVLGGVATLGLGVGLMALVFWSNRKGFDDEAGAPQGPARERKTPES